MTKFNIKVTVEPEGDATVNEGTIKGIIKNAFNNGYEVELLEVTESEG